MLAKFRLGDYKYDYDSKRYVDVRTGEEVFPYISGYNATEDTRYYNPKTKFKSADTRDRAMREQEYFDYVYAMEQMYRDNYDKYIASTIYDPATKDAYIESLENDMIAITNARLDEGIRAYAAKDVVPYFKKYVQGMIEDREYDELQNVLGVDFDMTKVDSEVRDIIKENLQNLITSFSDKSVAKYFIENMLSGADYQALYKVCFDAVLAEDENAKYALDVLDSLREVKDYSTAVDTEGVRKLNWWIENASNNYLTETSVRNVVKEIYPQDSIMPDFQTMMLHSEQLNNIVRNLTRLGVI